MEKLTMFDEGEGQTRLDHSASAIALPIAGEGFFGHCGALILGRSAARTAGFIERIRL